VNYDAVFDKIFFLQLFLKMGFGGLKGLC